METREIKCDLRRKQNGGRSTSSAGSPGVSFVLREEKQRRKKKNMDDLISQYICDMFVAAKFQLEACNIRLVKFALIGYRRYHMRGSPIKSRKYQTCIIFAIWDRVGDRKQ